MDRFFHSVTLDSDKCVGCTNCIKRCPTEAIRVRNGKAHIISERCIDCGECIRVCPHHAKKANSDPLESIGAFEYKIALPAPSLYGQFNNLDDIDIVLTGLRGLGFDEVFEVSRAAELVSEATRRILAQDIIPRPIISSACPAVVRLIRVRFPDLCDHVLPMNARLEVAAPIAKREAARRTGLPEEKIGAFFLTPCPAKVTDIRVPIGPEKSAADGAIAISTIFTRLTSQMEKVTQPEPLSKSGIIGVSWASSGGESAALLDEKYLAADGIENVIRILESLEDERIRDLDFIELNACSGGCVGGVLCVENGYVAKARLQTLRRYLPVAQNHLHGEIPSLMKWDENLEFAPVLKLSDDLGEAMRMMSEIDQIESGLPGLDCGSCGAPTCRAFAEDVVRGLSRKSGCIFVMKEQIQSMAATLSSFADPEGTEQEENQ